VQASAYIWCGTAGGTANALTLTPTPAITAYAAGQIFRFIVAAANTGAATVAVSGLVGPKAITKQGSVALVGSEMRIGAVCDLVYDGTRFQLLEPAQGLLQLVNATGAGGITTSVNPTFANLISSLITITPQSSGSRLLIEVSFFASISNVAATNTTGTFQLYETNTATPIGSTCLISAPSAAGGIGAQGSMVLRTVMASTGTTPRSFGFMGFTSIGTATCGGQLYTATIMEVL